LIKESFANSLAFWSIQIVFVIWSFDKLCTQHNHIF